MLTPTPAAKIQANLQDLFQADLTAGEAYIRLKLTTDISALLSMKQVQRSAIVETERITPIPGMPKSVLGIMSSRDRVFCVFNLAQLLNISTPISSLRKYQIIVLQTNTKTPIHLGLAVHSLQGIIRFQSKKINFSSQISPEIAPYVSGVLPQAESLLPILDFDRIMNAINSLS